MGSLFFVFEGTRKMLEFRRIFDECRRPRYAQARGVLRSRNIILVICEWTWHQDATSGCVQNIVNTMVFVRFTVWGKFEI